MKFNIGDKVKVISADDKNKGKYIGEIRTLTSYDEDRDLYSLSGIGGATTGIFGSIYYDDIAFKENELRLATTDEKISEVDETLHGELYKTNQRLHEVEMVVKHPVISDREIRLEREVKVLKVILLAVSISLILIGVAVRLF